MHSNNKEHVLLAFLGLVCTSRARRPRSAATGSPEHAPSQVEFSVRQTFLFVTTSRMKPLNTLDHFVILHARLSCLFCERCLSYFIRFELPMCHVKLCWDARCVLKSFTSSFVEYLITRYVTCVTSSSAYVAPGVSFLEPRRECPCSTHVTKLLLALLMKQIRSI